MPTKQYPLYCWNCLGVSKLILNLFLKDRISLPVLEKYPFDEEYDNCNKN